jgi:hypothetical protein
VHYPLLPLLLNTANVKVHRGDEVEESDPGISVQTLECAPSRVRLRSHKLISKTAVPWLTQRQ